MISRHQRPSLRKQPARHLRTFSSAPRPMYSFSPVPPTRSAAPVTNKQKHVDSLPTDYIVVGGGCAGLACATALAAQGYSVRMLEADERLGGRARSWWDAKTGHPIHIGPHVVYSDYPNYFKLLSLYGTDSQIVWQKKRNLFVTINGRVRSRKELSLFGGWFVPWVRRVFGVGGVQAQEWLYPCGRSEWFASWEVKWTRFLPPPTNWVFTVLQDPFVKLRETVTLVPFVAFALHISESDVQLWRRLDAMTADELLDKMRVSEKCRGHLLAFLSNAIINVPLGEVSAASFVSFFRRLVGAKNPKMGFIDGGLGTVLTPGEAWLQNKGAKVELGAYVQKLVTENGRVTGVEVVRGVQRGEDKCKPIKECVSSSVGEPEKLIARKAVVLTLPAQETLALIQPWADDVPARVLMQESPENENFMRDRGMNDPKAAPPPVAHSQPAVASMFPAVAAATTCSGQDCSSGGGAKKKAFVPDSLASTLSRFEPCRYVSVYLWFDRNIAPPGQPLATQFWAKNFHPDDLCCEFYDFTRIYKDQGPARDVLAWPGSVESFSGVWPGSCIGVNMIDTKRLDGGRNSLPPGKKHETVGSIRGADQEAAESNQREQEEVVDHAHYPDEYFVTKALEELVESMPTAGGAKLLHTVVNRVPMAVPRCVRGVEMSRVLPGWATEPPRSEGAVAVADICGPDKHAKCGNRTRRERNSWAGWCTSRERELKFVKELWGHANELDEERGPCQPVGRVSDIASSVPMDPMIPRLYSPHMTPAQNEEQGTSHQNKPRRSDTS